MFIFLLLVAALCAVIYIFLTWHNDVWCKAGVLGPKPTILLGNMPSMITQKRHVAYEIDDVYQEYKKLGVPFAGMFQLREPRLVIFDPELIKDIFIRKFNHFHDNEFGSWVDNASDPLLARNPFMLTGEQWKEKRAEITPAFTSSRIKALSPLIDGVCKTMISYINTQIDRNVKLIETRELSAKFTTDVVSNCIFAVDANSFSESEDEGVIRKMGKRLMTPSLALVIYFALSGIIPGLSKIYKLSFVPKDIEKFFTDLMVKAEKHRNENQTTRIDYLDHLIHLKQRKGISSLDMAAHGVTFFIDGFDTSSTALSTCLYEIARNKEVQERLRKEIQDNLESDGGITVEKIIEMKYLEQVLAESLRLYTPALFLTKMCTEPIAFNAIKDHKVQIEKGNVVIIPLYSIQRDAQYFPDPLKFDPERFSEKNGGVKSYEDKGVYLPFGLGPRVCLGRRFAITQVKFAIVEIVNNFNISVDPKTIEPIELDPKEFNFMPKGGIWLNYQRL